MTKFVSFILLTLLIITHSVNGSSIQGMFGDVEENEQEDAKENNSGENKYLRRPLSSSSSSSRIHPDEDVTVIEDNAGRDGGAFYITIFSKNNAWSSNSPMDLFANMFNSLTSMFNTPIRSTYYLPFDFPNFGGKFPNDDDGDDNDDDDGDDNGDDNGDDDGDDNGEDYDRDFRYSNEGNKVPRASLFSTVDIERDEDSEIASFFSDLFRPYFF